jgi:SAM-dependent methyltransferase
MLAPRKLPLDYQEWNRCWKSPFGPRHKGIAKLIPAPSLRIRYLGPFAFQPNSDTRRFEFPWAYEKICRRGGSLDIVEVGGSRAGLQFVLARAGHRVTNVDPGLKARGRGWDVDFASHEQLCKAFGAPVKLVNATLGEANIESQSADVVLAVSVLEHLAAEDVEELVRHIPRILRPGGVLIATVDLFLDLAPFTSKTKNEWGVNLDIRDFLTRSNMCLDEGEPKELCGFDAFQPVNVLEKLPTYALSSGYPCLSQCFVARRVGPKDNPAQSGGA